MAKLKNSEVNKSLLKRLTYIDREIGEKRFPNKIMLSKRLGVSAKTIQRDIEFMRFEYDAPAEFSKQRSGYYYSDEKYRLNPLKIDASDLLAVAVTDKVLRQYRHTPYAKYFRKFYGKLQNLFDDKISIDVKDLDSMISFKVGPVRTVDEKIMETVTKALNERRIISVRYFTGYSGVESDREIDVYHIRNYHGDWYIVGYCHREKELRVFAVSRIRKAKLLNRYFNVPEDFDVREFFKGSFGIYESKKNYNIKLKIMNESVRYIQEKEWHKSQKIKKMKDGSIVLEFRLNSLAEIFVWVLALGADCEVLEPKVLREMAVQECSKSILNYK
jgi:predicted DNA-binding transcriptional regulator YafY